MEEKLVQRRLMPRAPPQESAGIPSCVLMYRRPPFSKCEKKRSAEHYTYLHMINSREIREIRIPVDFYVLSRNDIMIADKYHLQ